MYQARTLLGLHAQTSIHAGSGWQTGAIDLPIQREGHNGWPCVFGSSVKGALRNRAEQEKMQNSLANNELTPEKAHQQAREAPDIVAVFGPPTNRASDHAGALIVSDARLLLFPVRSLTSQFKWVTCPSALQRFKEDHKRLFGKDIELKIPECEGEEQAIAHCINPSDQTSTKKEKLFLEEYLFNLEYTDIEKTLIEQLAALMCQPEAKKALRRQLVIISDDNFTHLVNHATPVNAHIAIASDTKTAKDGALWYEETLPPEALLYTCLAASNARTPKSQNTENTVSQSAQCIMNTVLGWFGDGKHWLQIGANETVGMGWCAVQPLRDVADDTKEDG